MGRWAVARSISRPVSEWLRAGRFDARVMAVFERACDLVTRDGEVVALVIPQVGDGPLNVVVDGGAGCFGPVQPGAVVTLEGDRLRVGGLEIRLGVAVVWEPRPDWDTLRARRSAIASRLPLVRDLCLRHAPGGSLLPLVGAPLPDDAPGRAILSAAQVGAEVLREGVAGDPERLREGVARLAGLGGGLTPAGDDFLTGAMLWAWLAHPEPGPLCRAMSGAALPRTTTLSAAFLRAAARGECSAPWHALLAALGMGPHQGMEARIAAAVRKILSHGATSGADTLAGFMYTPSF